MTRLLRIPVCVLLTLAIMLTALPVFDVFADESKTKLEKPVVSDAYVDTDVRYDVNTGTLRTECRVRNVGADTEHGILHFEWYSSDNDSAEVNSWTAVQVKENQDLWSSGYIYPESGKYYAFKVYLEPLPTNTGSYEKSDSTGLIRLNDIKTYSIPNPFNLSFSDDGTVSWEYPEGIVQDNNTQYECYVSLYATDNKAKDIGHEYVGPLDDLNSYTHTYNLREYIQPGKQLFFVVELLMGKRGIHGDENVYSEVARSAAISLEKTYDSVPAAPLPTPTNFVNQMSFTGSKWLITPMWDAVTAPDGTSVTYSVEWYEIEDIQTDRIWGEWGRKDPYSTFFESGSQPGQLHGIEAMNTYCFRVRAESESGSSDWTDYINYKDLKWTICKDLFTVDTASTEYTGEAQTKNVVPADVYGFTPEENKDYAVTYKNNTDVGTATITITGIGDKLVGTVEYTFEITAKEVEPENPGTSTPTDPEPSTPTDPEPSTPTDPTPSDPTPSKPSDTDNAKPTEDTKTTTNPDGSVTQTVTHPDGSKTSTTTAVDGTIGKVETDASGNVKSVELTVSNGTATSPVEVTASTNSAYAPTIDVTVSGGGKATVEIPVSNLKPGDVIVLVNPDGTEQVVRECGISDDGVVMTVSDGAKIKVVDRGQTFNDVQAVNHWADDAIEFASARELLRGTDGGNFSPNDSMSRGMLATVLYRLTYEPSAQAASFGDVMPGLYYSDAVAWAAQTGVVTGYDNGSFGPNDNISREQLVTMLYRYAKVAGMDISASSTIAGYSDASKVSDYARDAMTWAVSHGLINGKDGNALAPNDNATRAEAATILMRFCNFATK